MKETIEHIRNGCDPSERYDRFKSAVSSILNGSSDTKFRELGELYEAFPMVSWQAKYETEIMKPILRLEAEITKLKEEVQQSAPEGLSGDELAVFRKEQRNIPAWIARKANQILIIKEKSQSDAFNLNRTKFEAEQYARSALYYLSDLFRTSADVNHYARLVHSELSSMESFLLLISEIEGRGDYFKVHFVQAAKKVHTKELNFSALADFIFESFVQNKMIKKIDPSLIFYASLFGFDLVKLKARLISHLKTHTPNLHKKRNMRIIGGVVAALIFAFYVYRIVDSKVKDKQGLEYDFFTGYDIPILACLCVLGINAFMLHTEANNALAKERMAALSVFRLFAYEQSIHLFFEEVDKIAMAYQERQAQFDPSLKCTLKK